MRVVYTLLFIAGSLVAKASDFKLYEWEKDRARYSLSPEEQALSELILKHHMQYDYTFEKDQFIMYSTIHRITFVNNDEAIQKHNRIVISMGNTIELVELKARSINKEGKVVFFDKSNLKELKNEDTGKAFRIFAIEGIEIGSEVEYYFIRKMQPSLFDRSFMQFGAPVKNSSFLLTSPNHLKFDFKSYHDYPNVTSQDDKERNVYQVSMLDVPGLKDEPFSYFEPNRKRIEFKFAYNTAKSQARLYTWDEAAKTFYRILTNVSKEDEKALEKFVKALDDNPSKSKEERIVSAENKIKSLIQVNKESSSESLSQIESILKSKLASHEGMAKLFMAVFKRLSIPCYPVVTCSREDVKFDGDFDSWAYLDEYVLYFPDTKKFISPYNFEMRYPLVEPKFTAQKGLFIEPFSVGEVNSALASIHEIPAIDYSLNTDDLDIDVVFNDDLASSNIKQKREFSGYNAASFVHYYDLMTPDQRLNMIEELTKQTAPDAAIKEWTAKNVPGKVVTSFVMDVNFESTHFIERAGPRILFKVGELIGPQVEMYRDDARVTPVENGHNRGYDRKIVVHIPAGYQVKNLQDLKIDVTVHQGDKIPFSFQSDYTVKDNLVEIIIKEYYKEIYAPVSQYEDFRKVVNAAADFNKITLVLEHK